LANTKSAAKAQRQNVRRAARNRSTRSAIRTHYKKAATAVAEAEQQAADLVRQAVRALDKAAQKGVIHRNSAARRKSRLMARLHTLSLTQTTQAAQVEEAAPKPTRGRRTTATGEKAATSRRRTTTASKTTSTASSSTTTRRRTPKPTA
jgi:small subunit ribosomal protein S20